VILVCEALHEVSQFHLPSTRFIHRWFESLLPSHRATPEFDLYSFVILLRYGG